MYLEDFLHHRSHETLATKDDGTYFLGNSIIQPNTKKKHRVSDSSVEHEN
jgi:hypothetical protein